MTDIVFEWPRLVIEVDEELAGGVIELILKINDMTGYQQMLALGSDWAAENLPYLHYKYNQALEDMYAGKTPLPDGAIVAVDLHGDEPFG